ncbi:MAG: GAF domain-containing sensor histidine kinase [Blastocatellia bacterium]|nr:GAF domain-containing sensor histidine kinase [Blastocatellia bacterium]
MLVENDATALTSARDLLPKNSLTEVTSLSTALGEVAAGAAAWVLLGPDAAQALLQEVELRTQERTTELAQAIETLREQVLDTQRMEAEIRRENQELAILNSIPAAVSTSLDLTEVLLLLKQQLSQQLGVSGGCIYLYDQQGENFELKETWGFPDRVIPQLANVPAQSYPANEILRTRKPFLVAEIKKDRLYLKLQLNQMRPEWQSCLGVPVLADGAMQGVVVLFSPFPFNDAQIAFYTSFGRQVGAAFHHARLFEQFFVARERTQVLSKRLVAIQEEERRNLARELHDEIGQILTGLKLILEMSLRLPPDEGQANVQEAQKLVGELMSKVRQISLDLRPGMLDDLGLLPALLWYFERYTTQTKVQVGFKHRGLEGQRFLSETETAAYRIIQEALTNVARHASVYTVSVNVWADLDILCVEVEDQGAGFDPQAALEANTSSGVAGMGERARLLGGGLTIESESGKGTLITAHLPLWDETT